MLREPVVFGVGANPLPEETVMDELAHCPIMDANPHGLT